jgi:hypothetical protein
MLLHFLLLTILCASFGSLTQVPLRVETSPGDSKAPQLKYFTLDYENYTNKFKDALDLQQISDCINGINTDLETLFPAEEERKMCGQILMAYSILRCEMRRTDIPIEYFRAKFGSHFLTFYLGELYLVAKRLINSANELIEEISHVNFVNCYVNEHLAYFSNNNSNTLYLRVESLMHKKVVEDPDRFFPLIFRGLLRYPDGSQAITIPQFTKTLTEMINEPDKDLSDSEEDDPQPIDLKEKIEKRVQSLCKLMEDSVPNSIKSTQDGTGETSSSAANKESKPGEQANKPPEMKDEDKAKIDSEKDKMIAVEKVREGAEEKAEKHREAEQQAKKDAEEKTKREKESLGGETSPSDSNAPQLKYFILDYNMFTNKSKMSLDLIRERIISIDSAIAESSLEEKEKQRIGIILRAYCILFFESHITDLMIEYFKTDLGYDILSLYLDRNLKIENIVNLANQFVVEVTPGYKLGYKDFEKEDNSYFSDTDCPDLNFNVKALVLEKLKEYDAEFFPSIFKDLLLYPDGSQVFPINQLTLLLKEMIDDLNDDNPQPADLAVQAKLKTRAQNLFDMMTAPLSELDKTSQKASGESSSTPDITKKLDPLTNKSHEVKDEDKAKIDTEKAKKDAEEKARKEKEQALQEDEKVKKEHEKAKELLEKTKKDAEVEAKKKIEKIEEVIENSKKADKPEDQAIKETESAKQKDTQEETKKPKKDSEKKEQDIKDAEEKARKEQEIKEQAIKDARGTEQKAQEETEDEEERQDDLKAQEEAEKLKSESEEQARKKTKEESNNSSNDKNTPNNRKAFKIALAIFCPLAFIGGSLTGFYFYTKSRTASAA